MSVANAPGDAKPDERSDLPWVRHGGAPSGVGVCLSGGGLRAASFAYGAVQGLQETRGLLYGKTCANHLAVVSGGSYLAAALTLNSVPPPPGVERTGTPLAPDTPEACWVSSHGTYFKDGAVLAEIGLYLVVNLLAFASLFYFAALALVVVAEPQTEWLDIEPPLRDGACLYLLGAAVLLAGGFAWLRGLFRTEKRKRRITVGVLGLILGAPSIVAAMSSLADEWTMPCVAGAVGALYVAAGVFFGIGKVAGDFAPWTPIGWLGARIPAIAGFVLLCFITSWLAGVIDVGNGIDDDDVLVPVTLAGFGAVSWLAGRVSLHRLYRQRLATCFSVRRTGDDDDPVSIGDTDWRISCTKPPDRGRDDSFPRLLICATANIFWDRCGPGYLPSILHPVRRRRFASFVYSYDRCGIPELPGAWFETKDLEKLKTHASVHGDREHVVSLMTAVASTGAAASPAMGRKTSSFLRTTCALTNVRLGRWLPNPMNQTVRSELWHHDPEQPPADRRALGSGFNEFVPELFGLHRADSPRVYISDGGHYDNLGLIALLHARCEEIWCVDAQADDEYSVSQLSATLDFAASEKYATADRTNIDTLKARAGHAIIPLTYPGGGEATLVVIRLTAETATLQTVVAKLGETKFPHHSTFWPPSVMWYEAERFRAYGDVGYENATAAADAFAKRAAAQT